MNEEPRYMQDQYAKQADDSQYQRTKEGTAEQRRREERALAIQRRALKGGGGRNRAQTGVTVISGNPNAVKSDTRGDGTSQKSRPAGVPTIMNDGTLIDAPKPFVPENEEEEQTLFEAYGAYSNDKGGEL